MWNKEFEISFIKIFRRKNGKKTNKISIWQKIMGVCDGLAKYMDKDSNLIRIIAVVLAVLTGGLLAIAYLIAGFVLPEGE